MDKNYKKLFVMLEVKTPNEALGSIILGCIAKAEQKSMRIRFSLVTSLSLASLAGIIVSATYVVRDFIQSGFYNYAKLFFSEGAGISLYWRELGMSLLESAPLVSITLFLTVAGVFAWSGSRVIKYSPLWI